jgi:hypothetical protein
MGTRRQTATAAENGCRRHFREAGFRVEAVPFIRARDEEFMAVLCFPATDVATTVQILTHPDQKVLEITRIHIGRVTYPGQSPECRVYVRWARSLAGAL